MAPRFLSRLVHKRRNSQVGPEEQLKPIQQQQQVENVSQESVSQESIASQEGVEERGKRRRFLSSINGAVKRVMTGIKKKLTINKQQQASVEILPILTPAEEVRAAQRQVDQMYKEVLVGFEKLTYDEANVVPLPQEFLNAVHRYADLLRRYGDPNAPLVEDDLKVEGNTYEQDQQQDMGMDMNGEIEAMNMVPFVAECEQVICDTVSNVDPIVIPIASATVIQDELLSTSYQGEDLIPATIVDEQDYVNEVYYGEPIPEPCFFDYHEAATSISNSNDEQEDEDCNDEILALASQQVESQAKSEGDSLTSDSIMDLDMLFDVLPRSQDSLPNLRLLFDNSKSGLSSSSASTTSSSSSTSNRISRQRCRGERVARMVHQYEVDIISGNESSLSSSNVSGSESE